MRQRIALEQRDLFRCSMRSTVSSCFSFNCLEVMRMTYFRSPASMCYTVDANQWADPNHRFHKCKVPWTWVKPGLTYTVSVAQQTVRRLPPPFASRCSDYKAAGKKDEFLGYLTQDLCIQECLIKQEIKLCNCIRPLHEYGSNFNVPTCGYQNMAICDKQITNKTVTKCMKKCGAPCEETSYDVRLTSLGEDRKEKERNSFSVYVKFSSDSQKIFEYQPKLTLIEAFGYMGGYIGMWLGLSLYSLITDAEKWLRDFFLQKALKRKAAFEMSSAQQQPRIFTTSDYPAWRSNPRPGDWGSIRNADSSPKILLPPSY
nr:amiloride-sensitive sodium channel subunit alpha-like [Rhipicephalus microplus]